MDIYLLIRISAIISGTTILIKAVKNWKEHLGYSIFQIISALMFFGLALLIK